tara:strand:- start:46 stop:1086 length:1041 start_codon:yes stop_codon:yes gene_type:complete
MLNKVVNVSPLSASRKYADVPHHPAAAGKATPDANPNKSRLINSIEKGVKILSNPNGNPPAKPDFNHNNVGNSATANDHKNKTKNIKFVGVIILLLLFVANCPPMTLVHMYPTKNKFCIHPICVIESCNSFAMGNAVNVKIVRFAVLKSRTKPSVITACVLCLNNANAIGLVKPTKFSSLDICSNSIPMSFFFVAFSSSSSPREDDDDDDDDEERARTIALKRSSSFLAENTIRFSFFLSRLRILPTLSRLAARGHRKITIIIAFVTFLVFFAASKSQSRELCCVIIVPRRRRLLSRGADLAPPSPTTAAASAERRHHAASRMDEAQSGLLVFGFSKCVWGVSTRE